MRKALTTVSVCGDTNGGSLRLSDVIFVPEPVSPQALMGHKFTFHGEIMDFQVFR